MKKKFLGVVIGVIVVAVLAVGLWLVYDNFREKPVEGSKTITVEIINGDSDKTITIKTDAEYLRAALEEEDLIAGDESDYGLYVKTVDGYTVDEANQEWWCFTKDGETLYTGVDDTPIADGDKYEITLTVGW